jgi:hypothetical protein
LKARQGRFGPVRSHGRKFQRANRGKIPLAGWRARPIHGQAVLLTTAKSRLPVQVRGLSRSITEN